MSKFISGLIREIAYSIEEMRQNDKNFVEADPEYWAQLFEDEIIAPLKSYKPTRDAAETEAFRGLFAEIRKVIDEALIPSTLVESGYVLEYQVFPVLATIAKKNNTVGTEILNDLKYVYMKNEHADICSLSKKMAKKIEKILTQQTKQADAFNTAVTAEAASRPGKSTSSEAPRTFRSSYFVSHDQKDGLAVTVFVASQENGKYTCVQDSYIANDGVIVNEEIGIDSGSGADFFPLCEENMSLKEAIEWVRKMEARMRAAGTYTAEEHLGTTPDIPQISELKPALQEPKKPDAPRLK